MLGLQCAMQGGGLARDNTGMNRVTAPRLIAATGTATREQPWR